MMPTSSNRLFFIDAMRAWAILMMLQGHFIDGLLDPLYRNPENSFYAIWLYFRGMTAPVFFTVSGFIFTLLLIRTPEKGLANPRVKKGIRRGLQLLLIGYLLRLNLFGILSGELYDSFYVVDVLHCIGLSILAIIGIYMLAAKRQKWVFPAILLTITMVLFLFEPLYKQWSFDFLPMSLANYLTKSNGSVFTIIPWLGYTTIGAFLAIIFTRFKTHKLLYPAAITVALATGLTLIFFSSDFFVFLNEQTGYGLFKLIELNNYLFIRLGDVFVVFALFMALRGIMNQKTVLKIGANTLSIYVIHFIILYGSFTGLGLYRFLHYELSPGFVVPGAILFMIACTYLALKYDAHEVLIKSQLRLRTENLKGQFEVYAKKAIPLLRLSLLKFKFFLYRLFKTVKN